MRFLINFERKAPGSYLPMNYHYFTGAWIYRIIAAADREFAAFLFLFGQEAPEEIHQMIYNCGFGEKNASGFGWVESLKV